MIAELLVALMKTTLATSAAVLLVLALRKVLMAKFGAGTAYAAWALVPVAFIAVLLPAPKIVAVSVATFTQVGALQAVTALPVHAPLPWREILVALWMLGTLATLALFGWQQRRFQRALAGSAKRNDGVRIANGSEGLPAVIGLLRPKIVLPFDFESRYDAAERELILCHERIHVSRCDLQANAIAAALRALFWFNPLMVYATRRFRRDQELACDARVIARHPQQRRSYADAMLKTHMNISTLPLACQWQASNPLKERIAMLKQPARKPLHSIAGAALVSLLLIGGGYAAWAAQPAKIATQSDAYYGVKLTLNMDGQTQRMELREYQGNSLSFLVNTPVGHEWRVELQLDPWKDEKDTVLLSSKVHVDGKALAAPSIAVKLGKAGSIELGAEGEHSMFRMEALVTRADLAKVPAPPPPPSPVSPPPPPPPPVSPVASVNIASKNLNPPRYPVDAAKQGITGSVVMIVDVAADGSVSNAIIEKSQPQGVFDAVSLEAVQKWKFEPAMKDGKPAAGRVRVPITFEMDHKDGTTTDKQPETVG
jgi:TonB family protein